MAQSAKIIGVHFKEKTYYAIYLYIQAFSSPQEIKILNEQAHISMQRADKYLMIAPLANLDGGNEIVFTNMPDQLEPREPYLLAFDFVKKRWQDIPEAATLDIDILLEKGPLMWEEPIANYLLPDNSLDDNI